MSKNAGAGELRTAVYFNTIQRTYNSNGIPTDTPVNVFGAGNPACMCKWVNVHGSDVYGTMRLELREPATITTRYSPLLLDNKMIIYKESDTDPYEVISIDDVENRHAWLEIKVQRKVAAR